MKRMMKRIALLLAFITTFEIVKGDSNRALADYDKAIKQKPDSVAAYIGRGDLKYQLGDSKGALADYEKALALKPGLLAAPELAKTPETAVTNDIALLAASLILAKDFDKLDALAAKYRSSKECYPNGVWKLECFYDGIIPFNQESDDQWDARLKSIERWVIVRPDSITARVAWANILVAYAWKARGPYTADKVTPEGWRMFHNRLTEASKVLKEARSLKEQCPVYWRVLLRDDLGLDAKRSQFDAHFAEAIKAEPDFPDYYVRRVIYLLPRWQGTNGEWQSDLIKVCDRVGGEKGDMFYAQVIWTLNKSAYLQNPFVEGNVSWPRVDKGFKSIEKNYPDSFAPKIERARLAVLSGDSKAVSLCLSGYEKQSRKDWDGAIADYKKAIAIKPDYAEAYSHRGFAKQAKGDSAGAMADFNKALEIDPKSGGTYYNRALTEKAQTNYDAALADLNKAIELDPGNSQAYLARAFVKQHKGDQRGALADFGHVTKLPNLGK